MASKFKKRSKKKISPARKRVTVDKRSGIDSALHFYSYEITFEPFKNSQIPDEVQNEMEFFFEKLIKSPETIIARIEELISKYPNVPQLYNYASVAYSNLNEPEKSKHYAEKNYNNNPDYLFAKLNYAEICMNEGNYDIVPEILDNKFDIKALYPERNVFHITEVVSFLGITGSYFIHKGYNDQVELIYKGLAELSPSHPYTKRMKQYLFMESVKKKLNMLIGKN